MRGFELLTSAVGPNQTGVDAIHRRSYRRASRIFRDVLEKVQSLGTTQIESSTHFYVSMGSLYSRLLLALVTVQSEDRSAELKQLLQEYATICEQHPEASIPHFRRHLVLDLLIEQGPVSDAMRRERMQSSIER